MDLKQFNQFIDFCAECHDGQKRKQSNTPYFSHPARVAILLQRYYPEVKLVDLCVAYGHDLIEDCITKDQLKEELIKLNIRPEYILTGIEILSEDATIHPRWKRKEEYIKNIIFFGDEVILITKLCDRLDNLTSNGMDERFLKEVYLNESEELLKKLVEKLGHYPQVAIDLGITIKNLKEMK